MKRLMMLFLVVASASAGAGQPMGGKWIAALSGQGNWRPAMRLASDFAVTQDVKCATLRASALGLYVPFVNGKEITDRRMMPGWTQYEHRVPSQTFDVTKFLVQGTNCLAALVGDGWYCGQISYVGQPQGNAGWGRYPCFRAELTLEFADGTVTKLGTGRSGWRSFYGDPATLVNDIYQGEEYDAQMDDTRWKRVGSKGDSVREVTINTEILDDIGQPVVVTRVLKPVKIVRRPSGTHLLDYGENIAGVERIRLKKAHQGASIVVRHGEDLDKDGNLWRDNLAFAGAKTVLHCGAAAPFEYAPRFTFYGFRYLEISGWPADEELTPDSVTVEVISAAVRETGSFECSNELINRLFANVKRSQQANFIDVPTDCPQRCERFGWTGDAQIFAETAMMNYDVRRFFVKWLGDLRLCCGRSGAFPDIAPWPQQGFDTSASTGSAGWADAGVVCPWMLYRKYGDRAALREAYPSIVKYVDLVSSAEKLNTIGDHLNLDQKTSNAYVAEALRIEMLRLASLAATALGEKADAARFAKARERFVAAFRARHFDAEGLPKERTQTAAAFAIAYGLCRDTATVRAAGERLKELITERGGHLATGFLGTPVLLRALTESGNLEAAYKLLEVKTSPGWLYPVTQGATTIWERWDAKVGDTYNESWMNSLNHYAYGSVAAWFYDTIAGIRDLTEEDPSAAGFRRFRLAPQPGGSLTHAKATHEIPGGGVISSAWERKDGRVVWTFEVPKGTTAEIVPPGQPEGALPAGVSVRDGRLMAKSGRYTLVCGGASSAVAGFPLGGTTAEGPVKVPKSSGTGSVTIRPGEGWTPLGSETGIRKGSALDFSGFGGKRVPAGSLGWTVARGSHFEFEKTPGVPRRFYGVNFCFTGNFMSADEAEELCTRLERVGYNAIRIHHYERTLCEGAKDGTTINPRRMAELDNLLNAAIRHGLYVTTDLFVSRQVPYRSCGIDREGVILQNEFKELVLCHEGVRSNLVVFSKALLGHVNPATGRRWADEPALMSISLVNENNPGNHGFGYLRQTLGVTAEQMPDDRFAELIAGKVAAFDREMIRVLRDEIGYRGLVTGLNGWNNPPSFRALRKAYDYVDDHFYVDHPQFLEKPWRLPSQCRNANPLTYGNPGIDWDKEAWVRHADRPYTITEWNFSGPGRYRGAGGIVFGAGAALQEMDGVWRFAWSHSHDRLLKDGRLSYFDAASDPLMLATERAIIALYLRGDMPADRSVKKPTDPCRWLAADLTNGTFAITTPLTAGVFSEPSAKTHRMGPLAVVVKGHSAAVWATALDGRPLAESRHLLVTHVTDVQDSGTVYRAEDRKVLEKWGDSPHLMANGTAEVALGLLAGSQAYVYALKADGTRLGEVKASQGPKGLAFTADIARNPNDATYLYEIIIR